MKYLMLLVWLIGSEPKSEVALFDSEQLCMDFGKARIARLIELHKDMQGVKGECLELELQEA